MRVNRYILPFWITLLYCSTLFSQTIKKLDLFDCIDIASNSSLQAFIAEHYYKSNYWEFCSYKAGRLPSLSLNMTPLRYNRNIVQRYDFENNIDIYRSQQGLQSYGSLSLSQNVDFTGGTFFVDSEFGFIKNSGDADFNQFTTIPVRIGYSQKIFGFNGFKWERKIEPLKFEKAKKEFLFRQQEIAENTVQYFFNLALAQKQYDLAVENKLTADTLYTIALEREKISSISHADVLTLELDKINFQNALINAELSLQSSQFALATFLNIEENVLSVIIPENITPLIVNAEEALVLTKENNPEYLAFKQTVLEAEREVDRSKKSAIFDASISASVGFNQVAETFSNAYKKPLQQDVFSISISLPILDWGLRKGKVNITKSSFDIAKLSVLQQEQNLKQEIISTVDNLNTQQNLIGSTQKAIQVAYEAYNINKDRFVIGKVDINSLILSQNRYKEAKYNYISTLRYYWASYYKLKKLTLYDFITNKSLSSILPQ